MNNYETPEDPRWKDIRTAVLKQSPMSPIKIGTYSVCPVCRHDNLDLYCAHCGQKIDWGILKN